MLELLAVLIKWLHLIIAPSLALILLAVNFNVFTNSLPLDVLKSPVKFKVSLTVKLPWLLKIELSKLILGDVMLILPLLVRLHLSSNSKVFIVSSPWFSTLPPMAKIASIITFLNIEEDTFTKLAFKDVFSIFFASI